MVVSESIRVKKIRVLRQWPHALVTSEIWIWVMLRIIVFKTYVKKIYVKALTVNPTAGDERVRKVIVRHRVVI